MVGNQLYAYCRCVGSGLCFSHAMVYNKANVFRCHDFIHSGNVNIWDSASFCNIVNRSDDTGGRNWVIDASPDEHDSCSVSVRKTWNCNGDPRTCHDVCSSDRTDAVRTNSRISALAVVVFPSVAFCRFFHCIWFIYLKNVSEPTKPKIDIISVLLSTIGFGGFVYGFSGSEGGFTGIIVVSIIALILFVFRQIRLKEPLLDLRAFKYPMFAVTTVLLIVVMMTLFSTLSLLPFLFQGALGLTVFASGLLLLPGSFVNGLMSPVAGKLFDRFGPRVLVIPATGMVVIIMWFFMQVSMNTSKITFLVLHICLMFALSMIMMPAQTNGLNQLPPRYYPHGIAILNTLSQIAGAIGVAFFIGVMTAGQHRFLEQSSDPSSPAEISEGLVAGINNAFMYGFALACIAFVLALFIKRTQPPKE